MSLSPISRSGSICDASAVPAIKSCLRQPAPDSVRIQKHPTPDFRIVSWTASATGAVWNADCLNTGLVKQARGMFCSAENDAERVVECGPSAICKLIGRFLLAIPATIARVVGTLFAAIGAAIAGGIADLANGRPTTITFNETVTVVRRSETPRFITPGMADPDVRYAFVGDTASFGIGDFDKLSDEIQASVLRLPPTDTFASAAFEDDVAIVETTAPLQAGDDAIPELPKAPSTQDRLNIASLTCQEDGLTISICGQRLQDMQALSASRDDKSYRAKFLSDAQELLEVYRETEADWRALRQGPEGALFHNQYSRAVKARKQLEFQINKYSPADSKATTPSG